MINGAGINSATPFLEIPEEEWDQILSINLGGVRLGCQVFGAAMLSDAKGGSIINIASLSGITALSRVFTYSATKAAVINLTQNLAREWAAEGIRVNALSPGFFPAEQNMEFLFNKDFFDDLPKDLQAILQYSVEAVSTSNTALALDQYSSDLQKLQKDHGVKVHRTSKEILDAQLKAWDELIPELEKDAYMKKVLDSQRAWVDRVVFYELMNAPDYALAYDHYFPGKLQL